MKLVSGINLSSTWPTMALGGNWGLGLLQQRFENKSFWVGTRSTQPKNEY